MIEEETTHTGGCQSAVYSPPAPCLDFRLMSSAISLQRRDDARAIARQRTH